MWVELWARAVRDPEVAARRELLDARWRQSIASIIRDGQAGGEFDDTVDADDLALRLASLIDGLAIQVLLRDREVSSSRMLEICAATASRELGFRWPARRAGRAGRDGRTERAPRPRRRASGSGKREGGRAG